MKQHKLILFTDVFECDPEIRPHLDKVFAGEYDVPYWGSDLTILDLGANCGAFSIWASHRWPRSIIHAYEPHPKTFEYLEKNLKNYPNVYKYNYGIGNPGMRVLMDGTFNSGEASLYMVQNNSKLTGQHVEVRSPLELPNADIIKLDIEGAELEVLPKLLKAGREFSAIMFEYHNPDIRREIDFLLSDYIMVKAQIIPGYQIGTLCFLHRKIFR